MQNRSKGIVLPIILIIMVVLSILGLALITRGGFDSKSEKLAEDKMQAHYLARSGIAIAKDYLIRNKANLPDPDSKFYYADNLISSETNQTFTINTGEYVVVANDTHNIIVNFEMLSTTQISLIATGIYKGQKDIISSTVQFKAVTTVDATESAAANINDGVALTVPDPFMSTSDIVVDATAINFIAEDGSISNSDAKKGLYSPSSSNPINCVVYNDEVTVNFHQSDGFLHSGTMFFANPDICLQVTNQATLNLYADFFGFYGNVYIQSSNSSGNVYLNTYKSDLTEDDILHNGVTAQYGLVYFDDGVTYNVTHDLKGKDGKTLKGYYFFPDGVDLVYHSNKLIPVIGMTSILLDKLDIATTFQATETGAGLDMTYN